MRIIRGGCVVVAVCLAACGGKEEGKQKRDRPIEGTVVPVDQTSPSVVAKARLEALQSGNEAQARSLMFHRPGKGKRKKKPHGNRAGVADGWDGEVGAALYVVCQYKQHQVMDAFVPFRSEAGPAADDETLGLWLRRRDAAWWYLRGETLSLQYLERLAPSFEDAEKRAPTEQCAPDPYTSELEGLTAEELYARATMAPAKKSRGGAYEDVMPMFARSCDGGHPPACEWLTHDHCLRDETAECVKYGDKACSLGQVKACSRLGRAYSDGEHGVIMNRAKAIEYNTKACELDKDYGCWDLEELKD
jgi:hypothetical protein